MSAWRDTTVIVPFRLESQRFAGKALATFRGRTLLDIAVDNALSLGAGRVIVTAPDQDLTEAAQRTHVVRAGVTLCPSSASCSSATERVVEIFGSLEGSRIVSLPVDEPALEAPALRAALVDDAAFDGAGAVTFYCPFYAPEDYLSTLSAKVVLDRTGRLLYMSRAVIPVTKQGSPDPTLLKKNVGVFAFKRAFLERLHAAAGTRTELDRFESLEQLRWLELGLTVRCLPIHHVGFGIDVPEQLARLDERLLHALRR